MDGSQLHMSIQEADNISLRNGAANRIVQLLQKQRYSNNENSAKRWVWELCQNAKDVCNDTDCYIWCQALCFAFISSFKPHNNLMSLILQIEK